MTKISKTVTTIVVAKDSVRVVDAMSNDADVSVDPKTNKSLTQKLCRSLTRPQMANGRLVQGDNSLLLG